MTAQPTAEEFRTDLAVRRHGRPVGEAPTLLFLHGLTDSGAGWPDAVEHWGDAYAILTLDQRGHGESPRFTPEQLQEHPGDVMVEDLLALLAQLGAAPVLIGHSLGGAVALAAAVRRPDLVRALVLEDPAVLGASEEQRSAARGNAFVAGVLESRAADGERALLDLRREKHPQWPESELLVTGRAEQQMDLDYLRRGDIKPSIRAPELFEALIIPALVISGDRADEICVDAETERAIADAANPNLTLARVPGAGHCIRRECPDRFYELVDPWLATH